MLCAEAVPKAPESGASEPQTTEPVFSCELEGVTITVLGTAHVSRASAASVKAMVESGRYDGVALELCQNRYQAIKDPDAITRMDLLQVIRSGKGAMVLASLVLGAFQQRIADQFGIEAGADMRAAMGAAERQGLPLMLVDRDIGITLKRIYRSVPWWRRLGLFSGLLAGLISRRQVTEEEVEQLKQGDVLDAAFTQFAERRAEIYQSLIDERDQYMVARLVEEARASGCKRILAVVGAGHMKGMQRYFEARRLESDEQVAGRRTELEQVPASGQLWKLLPWSIVAVILCGFGYGFSQSSELGWQMVQSWVLINGSLAAVGALIAAGHPLTVVSAFAAAPLTSLNPTISAGMVSAAVETMLRKPQIGDFTRLRSDTRHFSGWWGNRVARTLLVFLFTGLGSVVGTYVAGYTMYESIRVI